MLELQRPGEGETTRMVTGGDPAGHGPASLLESIRRQNLGAYESMPSRIDEDANQESQISQDYRGRLTFELLQNADDAMAGGGSEERIVFRLTDERLRSATLAALSATWMWPVSAGPGRAARPGRGTAPGLDRPQGHGLQVRPGDHGPAGGDLHHHRISGLDAAESLPVINDTIGRKGVDPRTRVPTMRLPWPLKQEPEGWKAAQADGLRVLFRFPLRPSLSEAQRTLLARRLLDLPVTAVLFLKHLDDVEVDVDTSQSRVTSGGGSRVNAWSTASGWACRASASPASTACA